MPKDPAVCKSEIRCYALKLGRAVEEICKWQTMTGNVFFTHSIISV